MKKSIIIPFLFYSVFSLAQNLVPNPSFEIYDTCPHNGSEIRYAIPWFEPTSGTPDYFNACNTTNFVGVPLNYFGYRNSHTGNGYAGFVATYDSAIHYSYREYLEIKLTDSLIANQKYFVSFYLSLADSCNFGTDAIGVYFSNDSILRNDYHAFDFIPSIHNPQGNFLTDKVNWIQFHGEYIAIGGEKFMTIGNFRNDSTTQTMHVNGGGNITVYNVAYYYIDDVTCALTSGINEYDDNSQISILSNPIDNILCIKSNHYKIDKISIFNVLGEQVYSTESIGELSYKTNLSGLQNGMYFLQIKINKTCLNKKIVIKH